MEASHLLIQVVGGFYYMAVISVKATCYLEYLE